MRMPACIGESNPVGYLFRRLQYQTNLGHTQGLTQVRGATSWDAPGAEDAELVDRVMVTCSKDGTAGVWTREQGAFRLLCFLVHVNKEGSLVTVNDAAGYVCNRGGSLGDTLHVLTGSADGCTRLWSFSPGPRSGPHYERFADKENSYGIAQRIEPEAKVYHECSLCKTNHAVLSLAVLPKSKRQTDKVVFNFLAGTAKGTAEMFAVQHVTKTSKDEVFSTKPEQSFTIVPITEKGVPMKHQEETSVYNVAVTVDFLGKKDDNSVLVATCDGLGIAKLWRLQDVTDTSCKITHLRSFVHQESGKSFSLRCIKFSPAINIHGTSDPAPRFLVTSSFNELKQEHSRIFAWSLLELMDKTYPIAQEARSRESYVAPSTEIDPETDEVTEHEPKRTFVFRANNIAFWFPRDTGTAITVSKAAAARVDPYVYCITSAPDASAKMFKLINMKTGTLTLPLLKDQRELSFAKSAVGEVDRDDLAHIVKTFRHKQPVQAVLAVRMREQVGRAAATKKETYALLSPGSPEQFPEHSDAFYIVSASEDCHANMWDPFTGQCVHALRSATITEMYLPLVLQFITTWQLLAFSLDNSFGWNRRMVKAPRNVANLMILDAATIKRLVNFPLSTGNVFLVGVMMSALLVLLFVVVVTADLAGREAKSMLDAEVSEQYRREVKRGQTGLTAKPIGPAHRHYRRLMNRLQFWRLFIWACSMVMMVPIVKSLVRFFDCNTDPDHEPPYYVERAQWIACYQGVHLVCAPVLAILTVMFMFLALPFRVVSGDASVVAGQDIWEVRQWRRNGFQKTSQTDLGPMQLDASHQFFTSVVETIAKIAAPIASIMLTTHVLCRAATLAGVHFMVVASAILFPTHSTRSISTLFAGIKCAGLWVSFFSILATLEVIHYKWNMWLLYGILLLHAMVTLCIYSWLHDRESRDEKRMRASMLKDGEEESPKSAKTPPKSARMSDVTSEASEEELVRERREEDDDAAAQKGFTCFGASDACCV